jgi:hypothetical protein
MLLGYEHLLQMKEGARAEIIGGQLVTMPAPRPRDSKPQGALGRFVGGPFDDDDGFGGPGGWWILFGVDIALSPHDIVRPTFPVGAASVSPSPINVRSTSFRTGCARSSRRAPRRATV